jgi:hypothetical protein
MSSRNHVKNTLSKLSKGELDAMEEDAKKIVAEARDTLSNILKKYDVPEVSVDKLQEWCESFKDLHSVSAWVHDRLEEQDPYFLSEFKCMYLHTDLVDAMFKCLYHDKGKVGDLVRRLESRHETIAAMVADKQFKLFGYKVYLHDSPNVIIKLRPHLDPDVDGLEATEVNERLGKLYHLYNQANGVDF